MGLFMQPFVQRALEAAVLSGMLCAFVGIYIYMKRMPFIGIALSEVAALGVAGGFLLGVSPEAAASVLTVVAALALWRFFERTMISMEAVLGILYCLAAAGAVILLAVNPHAESHGADLTSGNLLYANGRDVFLLIVEAVIVFGVHFTLYRNLVFVAFDPDTAQTVGIRKRFYDFLIYLTIGTSIALAMKICGVLFVFTSLVVPPAVGLSLCSRMRHVVVVTLGVPLLAAPIGLLLSVHLDLPTAPCIVCVECILVGAARIGRAS